MLLKIPFQILRKSSPDTEAVSHPCCNHCTTVTCSSTTTASAGPHDRFTAGRPHTRNSEHMGSDQFRARSDTTAIVTNLHPGHA